MVGHYLPIYLPTYQPTQPPTLRKPLESHRISLLVSKQFTLEEGHQGTII
jgi:hypothetical protein